MPGGSTQEPDCRVRPRGRGRAADLGARPPLLDGDGMIAALFPWLVGASVVLVGLAAVHLHCCPPKCGHLARMGWSP